MFIIPCVSHDTCHVSCVTNHMSVSCVICQVSHVTSNSQTLRADILREGSPPPTCLLSYVTCHVSHLMCHISGVLFSFFFTKWWSYSVEGLLSTKPTPSSFDIKFKRICCKYHSKWTDLWMSRIVHLCVRLFMCLSRPPLQHVNHVNWRLLVKQKFLEEWDKGNICEIFLLGPGPEARSSQGIYMFVCGLVPIYFPGSPWPPSPASPHIWHESTETTESTESTEYSFLPMLTVVENFFCR